MNVARVAGTLAAASTGAAVVAGGITAGSLSPSTVCLVGAPVAAAVAYGVGDRRFPLVAVALLYLGVGGAVVAGALPVPDPVPTGGTFLAVGVVVVTGVVLRWRTGNARRLAALPVDPGRRRRAWARVARWIIAVQSVVGRLAGVSVGRFRVGSVVLSLAWTGVVGGLTVAAVASTVPVATAALAGLLLALTAPFYVGTDWTAVDAPTPPEGDSMGSRLRAIPGAFVVDAVGDSTTGTAGSATDDDRGPTPLYRGGGEATHSTDRGGSPPDEEPSERPSPRSPRSSDGDDSTSTEDSDAAESRPKSRILEDEEEVQELPSVGEMGPANLAGRDEDGSDDEGESEEGPEFDPTAELDPETGEELGVVERVSRLLDGEESAEDDDEDSVDWMAVDGDGTDEEGSVNGNDDG